MKGQKQNKKVMKNSSEEENQEQQLKRKTILVKVLICSIIINFLWGFALKSRKKTVLQQNEEIKVLQGINKEQKEEIKKKQAEIEKKIDELTEKDRQLKEIKKEEKQTKKNKNANRGTFVNRKEKNKKLTTNKTNKTVNSKTSKEKVIPQVFETTMYTANEGAFPKNSPHYGTMASGKKVYRGAVAVPKDIPFGSKITLKNLPKEWKNLETTFTAEDRGGAIKTKEIKLSDLKLNKKFINDLRKHNQIFYKNKTPYVRVRCVDIYTPDLEEAKNWGRRKIEGYLIRK